MCLLLVLSGILIFFLRERLLSLGYRPLRATLQSQRPFFLLSKNVFGSSLPAGDGFLFLSRDEPVKFHLVSSGRQGLGHF